MAVLVAFIRGFARRQSSSIGNFWFDITRSTLYILLPLSLFVALVLVSARGRCRPFSPYAKVTLIQPTTFQEPVVDADGKPVLDAKGQPTTQNVAANRAGHRGRSGGFADCHQAVGHQRRRLLQRQFVAPVRESHADLEFLRVAVDPRDFGGPVLHVRQYDQRHATGLGRAGGHVRDLLAAAGALLLVGTTRQRRRWQQPAPTSNAGPAPGRRQHGGQGSSLRHCQLGAVGNRDDELPPTAASTRCTTPTRRWAASCRCG